MWGEKVGEDLSICVRVDKGTMTNYTRFGLQNGGIILGQFRMALLVAVLYHSHKSSLAL